MTEVREAVREGSSPEAAAPQSEAGSAQRAKSITRDSPIALQAVTDSARWVRARLARLGDRPGSRPGGRPGFGEARDWHHKCAGYYGIPVVRWARLAWGYAHMALVKSSCEAAEWLTESPPRFFTAAAVLLVLWLGS